MKEEMRRIPNRDPLTGFPRGMIMIEIIKHGILKNIKTVTCPSCLCEFTYEDSDLLNMSFADNKKGLFCPDCDRVIIITEPIKINSTKIERIDWNDIVMPPKISKKKRGKKHGKN